MIAIPRCGLTGTETLWIPNTPRFLGEAWATLTTGPDDGVKLLIVRLTPLNEVAVFDATSKLVWGNARRWAESRVGEECCLCRGEGWAVWPDPTVSVFDRETGVKCDGCNGSGVLPPGRCRDGRRGGDCYVAPRSAIASPTRRCE